MKNLKIEGKSIKKKKIGFKFKYSIFLLILSLVCGVMSYRYAKNDDYLKSLNFLDKEMQSDVVKFNVPYGAGTKQIADSLYKTGVIKSKLLFRIVSRLYEYDGKYQAGMHILSRDYSYSQIMNVLTSKSISTRITIPEGCTYRQIVDLLVSQGIVDEQDFVRTVNEEKFNYKFLEGLEGKDNWLEGYLFPDTYEFLQTETSREVIDKFLKNFDKKFEDEYYIRAKQLNMKVSDVITLASIVEKEAKLPQDRRRIAGVFYNRLHSDKPYMRKLQSCATIQYILLDKNGTVKKKLTKDDLAIDSPYNTYINEGLPKGPICSPGKDAIEAVLYPENNDYYFFVAKKDGGHIFSKEFDEHVNAKNSMR
jgi:UPF0755 protein